MANRFALGFTIILASLTASPVLAGQHTADAQHSARVLHFSPTASSPALETDYESRSLQRFSFGRLGPHRQDLAIASFGTSQAAATIPGLIVYFNFNGGQPPASDTSYAQQGGTMVVVGGGPYIFGTTTNAATGDTAGGAELFSQNSGAPSGGFTFGFNGAGLQNMVLSLASAGQPGGSATQSLTYSIDGTTFAPLGTIPGTTDSGWQSYSFSFPAAANGAPSITIRDSINLDSGSASSMTLLDNVRVDVTAVPEPSTWFGAGLAIIAVAWMQCRRARSAKARA